MPDSEMTGNILLFSNANARQATASAAVKPEAILVRRVRTGDRDAFGELYKMFAPLVHGIILTRVPFDEVDDLAQEVFLSAFKNIDNLRDEAAVGAWLSMIARNRAVEYYRRSRPTEELSEDVPRPDAPRAEAREILDTIRALPDAYRETLILRLVEGMTGREIAEKTGLTPESVRVNLHRGMKILREKLGITE